MDFLANYGLFLAKIATVVIALLVLVGGVAAIVAKGKGRFKDRLQITALHEKLEEAAEAINTVILPKKALKQYNKAKKAQDKKDKTARKRIFVLNFQGDIRASNVTPLREEITAILTIAKPKDEVIIRLESPGGLVHAYGLAASQLDRIKQRDIKLVVAVDKVAASGGYMMACVADKIIAAPFAIIGSIGVVAQIPNFHRLLKKCDIDFELITAGDYKRTLTVFGENTEKGREKFREEIDQIHDCFKDFIVQHRPVVNVQQVATGEHWLATQAKELNLVDELMTSDDYLLQASKTHDLFEVNYAQKKPLLSRLLEKTQLWNWV